MYNQLIQANLSVVGQSDECLVYVREIFGVAAKYPDAAEGWTEAQYKHAGEQPPTDATVPVWFSWDGPTNGHVAVSVNGSKFYSVSAKGDKVFDSLQALMSFIGGGIAYLGWSEDVDGVRVVQPAPTPASAPSGQTIYLPPTTGPWHLYKVGGPYNPAVPADVKGLLKPSEFGGLTYAIDANRGNGVYTITTEDFGQGDIWTSGSDVTIK